MIKPFLKTNLTYSESPNDIRDHFIMHTHENYEIYCFLEGNAKYRVESTIYPLKPNDIFIMKKGESHTLLINKNGPYRRMVISFNSAAILGGNKDKILEFLDERPLGQYNRYPSQQFPESHWIYYLEKACLADDFHTKQLYFNILLSELCENAASLEKNENSNDAVTTIISYINRHLTENLSLERLCTKFFISKSHLNRKFKYITGATVWDYIKTKRLILAKELLQNGTHPTEVASKCGFNDYSAFFYAYKSKFGIPPKNDMNKEHS